MKWDQLIESLSLEDTLIYAVVSGVRKKSEAVYERITFKPMMLKDQLMIQVESFTDKQAFHENLEPQLAIEKLKALLPEAFKQCQLFTVNQDFQVMVNRLGDASVKKAPPTKSREIAAHDRKKHYVLEEGTPVDFLIELGVMDATGKVFKKKYDKFKQLNKFLEFIEATLSKLDGIDCIRILDFGCGKAYLTFALYHYLVGVKGRKVSIVGLDLKEDVIAYCNSVAEKLHYEDLTFQIGDIRDYEFKGQVDLVVTLHACDNATDEAIAKAVQWEAKVILSVPCCQHEFFDLLESETQEPILKHGILRDKLNSLVTDGFRGLMLEALGYEVQMMEFIDMTHTPKNVLIRAFRRPSVDDAEKEKLHGQAIAFRSSYGLQGSYLENTLAQKGLL